MHCRRAESLVDAYADGEVHELLRSSIERHLRGCPACRARLARITALRGEIRAAVPRFTASPELRKRVLAMTGAVRASTPTERRRPQRWRWVTGGLLAGVAATLFSWTVGTAMLASRANEDLANEAVAAHVRATLGDRLIQVASSDQHTVKPWLSARLDYSPPVRDLASEGFALEGGRLDSIDQRPVAALVYRYREHTIDVFVCPEAPQPATSRLRTVRGFHVAHARGASMDWVAVSDAEPAVLDAFVQRLAREDASE
jgi:anti-sigma factor RsiW